MDPGTGGYLTIGRPGEAEIEVRRSRFRCLLTRAEDEAAARAVIDECRRAHWDARHHCSAYVLGPTGATQRSNDDGEPPGTAGAPMLEVLRGHDLTDVVAVVVRWFGGVLLGAGGLVRAYGDAVRAGVEAAALVRRTRHTVMEVTAPHAVAARLEQALRVRGVCVVEVEYAAQVTLRVAAGVGEEELVAARIAAVTGGLRPQVVGHRWLDEPA